MAVNDGAIWAIANVFELNGPGLPAQIDKFTRASAHPVAVLAGSKTQLDDASAIAIGRIAF